MQLSQECSGTNDKSQTGDPFEIDLFLLQYSMGLAVVDRLAVLRGEFPDAVDAALSLAAIYVIMRHGYPYFIKDDFPGAEMVRHGIGDDPVHIKNDRFCFFTFVFTFSHFKKLFFSAKNSVAGHSGVNKLTLYNAGLIVLQQ